MDDHLSSLSVAEKIERISACERITLYADLLAADRVYLSPMSPWSTVSSYLTPFTLTYRKIGGIVSVALSLGSPPAAVSGCYILRCPDFPLACYGERLSNELLNNHYSIRFPTKRSQTPVERLVFPA